MLRVGSGGCKLAALLEGILNVRDCPFDIKQQPIRMANCDAQTIAFGEVGHVNMRSHVPNFSRNSKSVLLFPQMGCSTAGRLGAKELRPARFGERLVRGYATHHWR